MSMLVLFSALFAMILIGVPVGFAIGGATIIALYFCTNLDLVIVAQYSYSGLNSFTILSVPFFMLAGGIMSTGGIAKRIVIFAKSIIGTVVGGLGAVAVLASMFFGAISGSGMATTAAIGGMMLPEMKNNNYNIPYNTTLICFAGGIGVIIPPSISFIMYGVVTGTSIADLFLAGIIPGVILGLFYITFNYFVSKRLSVEAVEVIEEEFKSSLIEILLKRLKNVGIAAKDGIWALLSPAIILGGIYSGIFTPTEAACVSVVYSLIISMFVYKEMSLKDLYQVFAATAVLNGITAFLLGYSTVFSAFLSFESIPSTLNNLILEFTSSKLVFLIIVNIMLLVLGAFLDTIPAIVVMAPMLLPAAISFEVNPVHFGIIMAINLAIGLSTPPYGCNLFTGAAVARIKMNSMFKYIIPLLIVSIVYLFLITFIPEISLFLL